MVSFSGVTPVLSATDTVTLRGGGPPNIPANCPLNNADAATSEPERDGGADVPFGGGGGQTGLLSVEVSDTAGSVALVLEGVNAFVKLDTEIDDELARVSPEGGAGGH